ncbi:LacI family DNA-binding transcriptional regulator [Paraflavitalea sp. CAU 1676]|uniref:LacI family DNA-binding transcriptional regulator n=1 Tax=Paraflavitalea sp. CAU 1676 TaxID=3032598 RepID=UPI0023DBF78B|nr:LacI family DNA-binding transcriptional regulator [Paraflavitalea sp. CAU 1676]MDF2192326.1 LacI family DNA-binding transcriptional regulator [Paraflavitalea sp. CAU 1676]
MKNVTLKDIAGKAGVAPSTVSAVLNGKAKESRISDQLAQRVRIIADDMGYQPNHTAVSLRTGKTRVLGLIVEDISNVFFAALAKIIEEEADSIGYKVLYCSTENNEEKARERIRMFMQRQVDGFLITPTAGMRAEVCKLVEQKKPVVLMDRYFPDVDLPHVLVDNYQGARMAMDHLLEKGYRRVAYVTVRLDQIQMHQRRQAYEAALCENGLPVEEGHILQLDYHCKPEEAVVQIEQFLAANPQLDAIFFATNYAGVYGLEAIKHLGIEIPRQLAVICFDDHDIFRLYSPGITIVKQPVDQIAHTAMQLLIRQFEQDPLTDVPPTDLQVLQPARLVVRGST